MRSLICRLNLCAKRSASKVPSICRIESSIGSGGGRGFACRRAGLLSISPSSRRERFRFLGLKVACVGAEPDILKIRQAIRFRWILVLKAPIDFLRFPFEGFPFEGFSTTLGAFQKSLAVDILAVPQWLYHVLTRSGRVIPRPATPKPLHHAVRAHLVSGIP